MKLVKYNPFRPFKPSGVDQLFDDFFGRSISDFVGAEFTSGTPSVNVIEKEDAFQVEVAAPGLTKSDFNLEVDNDRLIISAEKKSETKDEKEGKYTRREFNYTSFKRSFHLSDEIESGEINASYANGVLKVLLPKKESVIAKAPLAIEIK